MKIILLILLSTCLSLAYSEYPRFQRRGPQQNGPPRPPGPPGYGKKWGKPPQKMPTHFMQRPYPGPPQQIRNGRPKPQAHHKHGMHIPVNNVGHHMQHTHTLNVPKFQKYSFMSKPQTAPVKNYYKNPVQEHKVVPNIQGAISGEIVQFPKASNKVPTILHKQEKPSFVSSPSIPQALEYDYHIQTNSIPTNTNPIKQVGEKGPIHTIPAPNLTPADKPSNMELRKQQYYQQQQEVRFQQPQEVRYQQQQEVRFQQPQYVDEQQYIHQYQVTEQSEQAPKHVFSEQINQQTHLNQNQDPQNYQTIQQNQQLNQYLNQQLDQQREAAQNFQNLQAYYNQENPGLNVQDNGNHGININFGQTDGDRGQEDMVFSNSKHYQVHEVTNDQYSAGDQTNQNTHTHAIQSSYAQQQPQVLTQFLEEPGYIQQFQQDNLQIAEDKNLNVQPEYHSFNYDEQAHQAQQAKSGQVSYVKAAYSLGSPGEIIKGENIYSRSSSVDPLTQAQIVQGYFENSRSGNTEEPDAKPSGSENSRQDNLKSPYYTSLPSKEAAERLAKLQLAGKVNSSLMQLSSSHRNHNNNVNDLPTIYVPDDNKAPDEKQDRIDQNSKEQEEYEDYSEEDENESEEKTGFGHKIKSRK